MTRDDERKRKARHADRATKTKRGRRASFWLISPRDMEHSEPGRSTPIVTRCHKAQPRTVSLS